MVFVLMATALHHNHFILTVPVSQPWHHFKFIYLQYYFQFIVFAINDSNADDFG